ncbi:helix-turn-helix domain-containing protein [Planomicrobium sp. CPCC 101079]|uniref:helix-turn-helix domain-containing protein n=1 Tax=Planomicrobium sp. CPCC 101079 TaxID=2599618 RepID=UPI0011B60DAC|nr:helix-turn-helix domain-containing protein [Planomicrobium sp. CPCC 101079]TWT04615.1 helix-turn-helix domain-containing protein [Planomicrobium sp. CPCC 101079]
MAKGKYLEWITEEGLTLLNGWARDGLTDEQIAHNIGISRSTLNEWKKKYPDISDTLKKGKEVVDRQVENALLKRALGYDYEEVTYISVEVGREAYDEKIDAELDVFNQQNPKATTEERLRFIASIPRTAEVVSKRVAKQVAPDVTAQIFWLKNRKPGQWRDKQEIEHSGGLENKLDLSGLSVEELRKLAQTDG